MVVRLHLDSTLARDLDGFYLRVAPTPVAAPRMLRFNRRLATELGLDDAVLDSPAGAALLSGNALPDGAQPLALAYAGHQFGGFVPQLGDGRALLLGEIVDRAGHRRDLQLKGSGRTPFSRGGDGRAALGPVLREFLLSDALHALAIPTTRALAAVATGEKVFRETPLPGAVLTRIAASHVRVGTFQFFAARGEREKLDRLTQWVIARHFPELAGASNPALALFGAAVARQAALVAKWMLVGFVHGVMNTDNMAISGETIDYGPCAFVDAYDPAAVFSSIDHHGRYAYGNQPAVARWNLARLAETLLPLIDDDPRNAVTLAEQELDRFAPLFAEEWLAGMRAKLGLATADDGDRRLAEALLAAMAAAGVDFTLAFRRLADAASGDPAPFRALFPGPAPIDAWLDRWRARLAAEGRQPADLAAAIRAANPAYVPRNHLVEEALAAAHDGDLAPFDRLLEAVTDPFVERPGLDRYGKPPERPDPTYRTFCGT